MMQLQSPTYTKGITESTILVGEPATHGNPDMGVLQNGMAAMECLRHYTIAFLCGFGCRLKGHSNGVTDNSVVAGWMRLPCRIHVSKEPVLIYNHGSQKSKNQFWYITAVLKESKNRSNSPRTEDFVLKSISLQVWCHQEIIPTPVSWQAVIQPYCILRVGCWTKLDDKTLLLLSNVYGNLSASCHPFFCFHPHCHASTSTQDHCPHIKIFGQWKQVTRPITNPICRFFQVAAMTDPEPARLL